MFHGYYAWCPLSYNQHSHDWGSSSYASCFDSYLILFQHTVHPVAFISIEFQSAALYNNAICTGRVISLPVTQETFYELIHGKNIPSCTCCLEFCRAGCLHNAPILWQWLIYRCNVSLNLSSFEVTALAWWIRQRQQLSFAKYYCTLRQYEEEDSVWCPTFGFLAEPVKQVNYCLFFLNSSAYKNTYLSCIQNWWKVKPEKSWCQE